MSTSVDIFDHVTQASVYAYLKINMVEKLLTGLMTTMFQNKVL